MPLSGRKSAALAYASVSMRAPAWLAAPAGQRLGHGASPLLRGSGPGAVARTRAATARGVGQWTPMLRRSCDTAHHERRRPRSSGCTMACARLARPRATGGRRRAVAPRRRASTIAPEASWGPPEVLAHVAEMLPFWQGEMERDPDGSRRASPVPFGRSASDPIRLGLIERDRSPAAARSCSTGSTTASSDCGRRLATLTDDRPGAGRPPPEASAR